MSSSLKDLILAADDIPQEDVDVPEWGVKVRVQGLTGTDRDAFEAKMVAARKDGAGMEVRLADVRSKLLVKCMFDPKSGERIFDEKEVQRLGRKSGLVIDRLFEVAKRLSGMDDKAEETAEGN